MSGGTKNRQPNRVNCIVANSIFEHDGSVVVAGNIGEGAIVQIINGNLTVIGGVGDGAQLITRDKLPEGSSVKMDKFIYTQNLTIVIEGYVGNDVSLMSTNIQINDAGNMLSVSADKNFKGNFLGDNTHIDSNNTIVDHLGKNSSVCSLGNFVARFVDQQCIIIGCGNLIIQAAHASLDIGDFHGNKTIINVVGAIGTAEINNPQPI